jgi:hypothetical protein
VWVGCRPPSVNPNLTLVGKCVDKLRSSAFTPDLEVRPGTRVTVRLRFVPTRLRVSFANPTRTRSVPETALVVHRLTPPRRVRGRVCQCEGDVSYSFQLRVGRAYERRGSVQIYIDSRTGCLVSESTPHRDRQQATYLLGTQPTRRCG